MRRQRNIKNRRAMLQRKSDEVIAQCNGDQILMKTFENKKQKNLVTGEINDTVREQ